MSWTILVPVKPVGGRKQRLAGALDPARRDLLVERLLERLLTAVRETGAAEPVVVTAVPLNPALDAARAALGGSRYAVVHADLPTVEADDVAALLAAAERHGAAIAPDRAGRGTNALAIADGRAIDFAFGADSFARHRAQAPDAAIVRRDGLAFDLDGPADLALLRHHRELAPWAHAYRFGSQEEDA